MIDFRGDKKVIGLWPNQRADLTRSERTPLGEYQHGLQYGSFTGTIVTVETVQMLAGLDVSAPDVS